MQNVHPKYNNWVEQYLLSTFITNEFMKFPSVHLQFLFNSKLTCFFFFFSLVSMPFLRSPRLRRPRHSTRWASEVGKNMGDDTVQGVEGGKERKKNGVLFLERTIDFSAVNISKAFQIQQLYHYYNYLLLPYEIILLCTINSRLNFVIYFGQ